MNKEEAIKWFETSIEAYKRILSQRPNLKTSDLGAELEASEFALRALEQTRWIPVSARLPDPQKDGDKDYSDWLQVTIDIGRDGKEDTYVCEAYYCFSENKWYTKRFVVGVVTAWMPLHEPYKAESEAHNG